MVLDNLKDVWNNQPESKIQFTETDIYKMIHKKSTSIVKWIFYISIIEFVIFVLPTLFMDNSVVEAELGVTQFLKVINLVNYVLIVPYFIYLFYKNYKEICVNNSVKKLLNDILKTKKTVSYYVYSQLFMGGFSLFFVMYKFSLSTTFVSQFPNINMYLVWVVFIVVIAFVLLILWLVYKLIYGLLLRKLKANYKELLKSER